MHIRPFETHDQPAVIKLWEQCQLVKPWNDPNKDIARKQSVNDGLFLIGEIGTQLVASAMGGYDGHRGWVNYLAVDPECQKQGLGVKLMAAIEQRLKAKGCPKLNLQIRVTNIEVKRFYQALGYKEDACISMGKRLIDDLT